MKIQSEPKYGTTIKIANEGGYMPWRYTVTCGVKTATGSRGYRWAAVLFAKKKARKMARNARKQDAGKFETEFKY